MSDRAALCSDFLSQAGWGDATRAPLAGDASARRYERLSLGDRTAVLMDAPADQGQDVRPFVRIAALLSAQGLSAPDVLAQDADAGFLLLEDLGDALFARLIEKDPARETGLYRAAAETLVALRKMPVPEDLPVFTPKHMAQMIEPAFDWFAKPLGRPVETADQQALFTVFETVLDQTIGETFAFCLRDCHAENLLWLPDRTGLARVGLLDFQDAVAAHPAYDMVSLLQDARRDLSPALEPEIIAHYVSLTGDDPHAFRCAYSAIGAQRHLRILGVFGRLSLHFGKPHYIDFVPRVWQHLMTCLGTPGLEDLRAAVLQVVPEPMALDRLRSHAEA
ncbi:aminoglycoside phosphotransferase family protein [Psychromarinibacter sp. S121]|uniref:aminoglycoside phosphotransferase family protein n=1 Tax=Psychromarinibacter sp. S121 TaxID=3415127 RepID=UPI003C7B4286